MKAKESLSPLDNSISKPENLKNQHRKKKKKKFFWNKKIKQEVEKKGGKDPIVKLPPKTPQEVSSNWKVLQKLLQQEAANLNSAVAAPETPSKKRQPIKEGRAPPQTPVPNETGGKPTFKAAEKAKKGRGKALGHAGVVGAKQLMRRNRSQAAQEVGKGQRLGQTGDSEQQHGSIKRTWRKQDLPVASTPIDIWFDDVDPDDIEAALGPEAAKVARENLGIRETRTTQPTELALVKEDAFGGLTKAVAMDCEMVGVGTSGEDSIVARVSVVNLFGKCVYDKYVKPTERVTDYRTAISGIRPEHLKKGEDFKTVQKEVADILRGRTLVGHALHNDLKILLLDHPKKKIRDTQRYIPFKQQVKSGRPSLKLLCEKVLNVKIQTSEHSSIQDAQAAMRLYTLVRKQWEASVKYPEAKKE